MKRIAWFALLALRHRLCRGKGNYRSRWISAGHSSSGGVAYPRIKVLVIHYTADNFDVSLATLTDKEVSSHYLIPEKAPAFSAQTADLAAGARRRFSLARRDKLPAR